MSARFASAERPDAGVATSRHRARFFAIFATATKAFHGAGAAK
jgi:hypothetical protein